MASTMCLRAAVHQLTSTPTKDLPFLASYLASALGDCGAVLSAPDNRKGSSGDQDASVLIQKLKARITSLLQDKTVEGRWTAIVLVKSIVEAGQWEILRGCEPWVRGLLGILSKPDPLSSKELCIITLTRIFSLTHRYPTLLREITTPVLPSYITACLNLVSVKPAPNEPRRLNPGTRILEPVLCSIIKLLPSHPTIFRPFSSQIHGLILPLVDSIHASFPARDSTVELAQRIFVSLHHCAPKNTSGDEWLKACRATMLSIHHTGNHLFRAISEQWEPMDPTVRELPGCRVSSGNAGDDGADPLGLPSWTGVRDGSVKMTALLNLLSNFVVSQTNSTVAIPLGSILDLTSRLTSLLIPPSNVDVSNIINPEIGRNEREGLWSELPGIHVATLDLLRVIIETFGIASLSVTQNCLDQALYVLEAERFNRPVRAATYNLACAALRTVGFSVSKPDITSMDPVIRNACCDLEEPTWDNIIAQSQPGPNKNKSNAQNGASNADAFLKLNPKISTDISSSVTTADATSAAASELLCTFLSSVPVDLIPATLRAEIDRTAILFQQNQTMMASVLNPMPGRGRQQGNASIMPFLARSNPHSLEVEGLLRPRMPVLLDGGMKNALDMKAYQDEADLDVQDGGVDDEHGDVKPISATPDIVLSGPPSAPDAVANTETHTDIRSKRTYEPEVVTPEGQTSVNTESATKKARTESHQPSDVKDARLGQGVTTLPFLKPSTAGTEESRKTTPPLVTSLDISSVGSREITAESRMTSKLDIGQEPASQPLSIGGTSEESDNEIPELNIEPDTDDEDEDSMVE